MITIKRDFQSMFTPYSIGIVIADKKKESMMIEVTPIETVDGYKGTLGKRKEKQGKVVVTDSLKANWLPISNSNRLSAPDVCSGERVMLYKMGDAEAVFWDTIFNETDLRKNEHCLIAFSNKGDQDTDITSKNSYWQSVDCIDKKVKIIHTSDNDKELTTYDIDIDTKKGEFRIIDGRDNSLVLKSSQDGWFIKSNKLVNVETATMNIKVKTLNIKATDINTKCTNYKIQSSMFSLDSQTIKINGNVSAKGSVTTSGPFSTTGSFKITGPFVVTGPAAFTPPISKAYTAAKT